jgi:hypothetical protein
MVSTTVGSVALNATEWVDDDVVGLTANNDLCCNKQPLAKSSVCSAAGFWHSGEQCAGDGDVAKEVEVAVEEKEPWASSERPEPDAGDFERKCAEMIIVQDGDSEEVEVVVEVTENVKIVN